MPFEVSLSWEGDGYGVSPDGDTAKALAQVAYIAPTVANRSVISVAVGGGGSGYTTPPVVSFSGGGGFGASAYAVLTSGVVTSIVILTPGAGYSSAPTVAFASGAATATATLGDVANTVREAARATDPITGETVPQVNVAHPVNAGIYAKSLTVSTRGPTFREVEINYSIGASPGSKHTGKAIPNPLATPRKYKFTPVTETVKVDRDYAGNPLTSSAGQPFADGATKTINYRTLEVIEVRSNYSNTTAAAYENTTNDDTWTLTEIGVTIASGCAKCTAIVPMDEVTSATTSIRVGYYFEIRGEGHTLDITDQGTIAAIANSSATATTIMAAEGEKAPQTLLNGDGGVLNDTFSHASGKDWTSKPAYIVAVSSGGGTSWKLRYTMYEAKDFDAFGF